jgi:hypothetical protein
LRVSVFETAETFVILEEIAFLVTFPTFLVTFAGVFFVVDPVFDPELVEGERVEGAVFFAGAAFVFIAFAEVLV